LLHFLLNRRLVAQILLFPFCDPFFHLAIRLFPATLTTKHQTGRLGNHRTSVRVATLIYGKAEIRRLHPSYV